MKTKQIGMIVAVAAGALFVTASLAAQQNSYSDQSTAAPTQNFANNSCTGPNSCKGKNKTPKKKKKSDESQLDD